jgi:hypothetical protein
MSMTRHGATEGGDGGKRGLVAIKRIPIVLDGGRVRRGFSISVSGSGRIVGFEDSNGDR